MGLYLEYYIRLKMDGLISGGGLKLGGLKVGFYGILCHQIPGPEAMGIRAQNSSVPKAKWPQVKLRNWHAKKIGIANKKVNGTLNFFSYFMPWGCFYT